MKAEILETVLAEIEAKRNTVIRSFPITRGDQHFRLGLVRHQSNTTARPEQRLHRVFQLPSGADFARAIESGARA